jgi:phospholipase C
MPPIPIEHVVIIVKENHGFDTYFGKFPGAEGDATLAAAASPPSVDPKHDHKSWLNRATGAAREQYSEADIPTYWEYAREFTLCDNYFTDVAGPSTPNHLMLITGDSPWVDNPHGGYRAGAQNQVDLPSLPAQLEAANLTWGNYGGYAFDFVKALAGKNKHASSQFAQDAQAGKLPNVSWLYADHPLSEHAPDSPGELASDVGNVTKGMNWTVDQVNAIVQGNLWPKVAVFITWDDWGGWADHVEPANVEQWTDGTQFRYGNRVPCLVVSPFAKQGHISRVLHSHVSIVRFCEQNFGLPSVNKRTAGRRRQGGLLRLQQLAPGARLFSASASASSAPAASAPAASASAPTGRVSEGAPFDPRRGCPRERPDHRGARVGRRSTRAPTAALRRDGHRNDHEAELAEPIGRVGPAHAAAVCVDSIRPT